MTEYLDKVHSLLSEVNKETDRKDSTRLNLYSDSDEGVMIDFKGSFYDLFRMLYTFAHGNQQLENLIIDVGKELEFSRGNITMSLPKEMFSSKTNKS